MALLGPYLLLNFSLTSGNFLDLYLQVNLCLISRYRHSDIFTVILNTRDVAKGGKGVMDCGHMEF